MADAIIKPGTRLLNNVGSFVVRDNRLNMVAFTGQFSTSYAIAITMTAQDTRAGSGNALIFRSYSDRNVSVTLTVQDWNLEYIAASVGSKIEHGLSELFVIEQTFDVGESGIITLEKPAIGAVSVKLPNGSRINVTAGADNTVDLSAYSVAGECVSVTYPFSGNAKSVTITADQAPYVANLILEGVISDSLVGRVGSVMVDIPSFAFDGNITITMNSDGTTSTTEMVGVALAVDGRACGDGMVYGYVKEFIEDDAAPQLIDIVASPSPIDLAQEPVPETQLITVVGSRGVMYSEVGILNSECDFTSSDSFVASVNANGLITAVGGGDAEIEVLHRESGLSDTIEVSVDGDPFDPTLTAGLSVGGLNLNPGLEVGGETLEMGIVADHPGVVSMGLQMENGEILSLGIKE